MWNDLAHTQHSLVLLAGQGPYAVSSQHPRGSSWLIFEHFSVPCAVCELFSSWSFFAQPYIASFCVYIFILNKYSREPLCRFLKLFLQNPLFSRPLPQNFHPKFLFDLPFLVFQLSKTIILCSGFLPLVHHPEIQSQSQGSPPLFPSSQVLYCLLFRIWSYPYIYVV